jgi:nucleoside-diphosphate-sugar epimerase
MSDRNGLVLVSGANGFIGSHLVEALLALGYRVRCMVRRTSDLTYLRGIGAHDQSGAARGAIVSPKESGQVEWAYTDINDREGLHQACTGVDVVFHCAALTRALNKETMMRVNAGGTMALAQACVQTNPSLQRFVLVSSHAAAGPCEAAAQALDEDCAAEPITWYGQSKLAAEQAVRRCADRMPVTIVRPAAVLGPRDRDFFAYFRLVNQGLDVQIGGDDRWVSLIYVIDLVSLLILAMESERAVGQTYFGCGLTCRRTELSTAIARALGKRTQRLILPTAVLTPMAAVSWATAQITHRPALLNNQRLLDIRQRYWVCSGEKAQRELGFAPAYDLDAAVQETADWYRRNGWLPASTQRAARFPPPRHSD